MVMTLSQEIALKVSLGQEKRNSVLLVTDKSLNKGRANKCTTGSNIKSYLTEVNLSVEVYGPVCPCRAYVALRCPWELSACSPVCEACHPVTLGYGAYCCLM